MNFPLIGNETSCRPIQSVIILLINKSDSRCAVVRFCYHSYDYRSNWTPLSPITITWTNHKNYNFLACDWSKKVLFSTNSHVIGQFVIGQFNKPITFKNVV